MRKHIALLLAIMLGVSPAMAAKPIGTIGNVDTLTVGGRVFTNITTDSISGGLIILQAYMFNTSHAATFRRLNGNAGYVPGTGHKFTVHEIRICNMAASTASAIVLAQSDNDVGFDSASSLSGALYESGTQAWAHQGGSSQSTTTASSCLTHDVDFAIKAGKYLSMGAPTSSINNGAASAAFVTAYGYETNDPGPP